MFDFLRKLFTPHVQEEDVLISGERYIPKIQDVAWGPGHLARYEFATQFIQPDDSILDIACGVGYGTQMLQEHTSKSVVGIDRSAKTIKYAQENYLGNFLVADFFDTNQYNTLFDVVVSFETLEHIPVRLKKSLEHLVNLSNRLVILSVPYKEKPRKNKYHYHFKIAEKHFSFLNTYEVTFWYQEPNSTIHSDIGDYKIQNLIVVIKK